MKFRHFLPICCALFAVSCQHAAGNNFQSLLKTLDNELANSSKYVETRHKRIRLLLDMRENISTSPEQQYQLNQRLYDEYFSFQFDSTLHFLNANLRIAERINNKNLTAETLVELGLLYTTSGMYLEAREVLTRQIDSTTLSPEQLKHYYWVQQRFYRDFHEYSKHFEMAENATRKLEYYRTKLFEVLDPDSEEYLSLEVSTAMDSRDMKRADSVNRILLARHTPDSHEYAMHAYDQALIGYALEDKDFAIWYIHSALADVMTATRDNASICSLARELFEMQDINRAFRYILLSMDDAIFYNAKLRPWQIAQIMPIIEKSYNQRNETTQRTLFILTGVILLFALYSFVMFRRAHRSSREIARKNAQISSINEELSRMNAELVGMNRSVTEANCVKEEYIGLLLSMCSNYIEKLLAMQHQVKRKLADGKGAELQRELSSTTLMDAEMKDFYNMFDGAFLRLYPDFVEEFNSLIKDDERISLHKGELLNTELRIFALIRLGIDDSSKIAALLRYSVNTIYNYRAKVKNKARCGRGDFEDRIKTIGSFKS